METLSLKALNLVRFPIQYGCAGFLHRLTALKQFCPADLDVSEVEAFLRISPQLKIMVSEVPILEDVERLAPDSYAGWKSALETGRIVVRPNGIRLGRLDFDPRFPWEDILRKGWYTGTISVKTSQNHKDLH